jgi:hypothetical protein
VLDTLVILSNVKIKQFQTLQGSHTQQSFDLSEAIGAFFKAYTLPESALNTMSLGLRSVQPYPSICKTMTSNSREQRRVHD